MLGMFTTLVFCKNKVGNQSILRFSVHTSGRKQLGETDLDKEKKYIKAEMLHDDELQRFKCSSPSEGDLATIIQKQEVSWR